jgi:hypothetical protein
MSHRGGLEHLNAEGAEAAATDLAQWLARVPKRDPNRALAKALRKDKT